MGKLVYNPLIKLGLDYTEEGGEGSTDASTLNGQSGPYYLDRANHTGSNDADLLEGQPGSYYLDLANHTGVLENIEISGEFVLSGAIHPPAMTGTVNNYSPTGLAEANCVFISSSGLVNLTGIDSGTGAGGRVLFLSNVGTSDIKLKNNDINSLPQNRFYLSIDVTLKPNNGGIIIYNDLIQRWVIIAVY